MLVEHAFITTREANDALASAETTLVRLGFKRIGVFNPETDSRPCRKCGYELRGLPMTAPCPECGLKSYFARRVEYARGKKTARQAIYRLERQPQRIFIEFDRGKVSVAASIEPYAKPEPVHKELLLTIATLVERCINQTADAAEIDRTWETLGKAIRKRNRRKALPRNIIVGTLLLFIGFIVVVVAVAIARG